jgi:hypothetical protein
MSSTISIITTTLKFPAPLPSKPFPWLLVINTPERRPPLQLETNDMCEFVSVVATADGPLQLYAAPGLNSHGQARAGWNIKGGAEVEWTGENHDSLTVRYENAAMVMMSC